MHFKFNKWLLLKRTDVEIGKKLLKKQYKNFRNLIRAIMPLKIKLPSILLRNYIRHWIKVKAPAKIIK